MAVSVLDHLSWKTTLMILITIVTPLIILNIFISKLRARKTTKNLPPGSYGWPILGETLDLLAANTKGSPGKFTVDRFEKYKSPVFKTCLLGQRMAVLCGPAGNKFLFSNENKLVTVWWPSSVRKLLGPCISTTGGVEGLQMRKMVSYFFSPDAFTKLYIRTMDVVSRQHLDAIWDGKEELKVYPAIKMYTFELACRLFMSVEEPRIIAKLWSLFNVFLGGVISIDLNIPGTRFFKAQRATAAIRRELLAIVRQRKAALERRSSIEPSRDLLSHLLVSPDETGKFMPESVIVNNVLLLLFAGHDTSSSAITMLIKYLAELPEVYEKVLKEQNEIASSKEPGEYLQWEDVQKMRYSWNVVSETMRLHPTVTGAYREALTDISYEGYDIPKGWKFYWSALLTHTDHNFFPDSMKFDPSRFEGDGPTPYSYVPFGGGPRMCLGKEFARLEMLTFLYNVIGRFRWELVSPGEKIIWDPVLIPEQGLPVRIHPHKAS